MSKITADRINAEHNENIVGLQTTDEKGNAPESRIKDCVAARSLIDKMREMDDIRARKRALVQGLIDGNPPYDQEELKRLGQGQRSNFNPRDAEGHIDARKTSYYTILTNVPCLVEAVCEISDPQDSNMDYGKILAARMDEMLRKWSGFTLNMKLHQSEMVKFAVGPVYFPNETTWKYKAIKHGSLLIPNDADASVDTLEMCCLKSKFRAHELYRLIATKEKEAASKKDGWDTDLIKLALMRSNRTVQPKDGSYSTSQYEEVQQMMKNNDYYYSYGVCDPIYVYHLMVKEYNGKVSHYIMTSEEADNEFLYQKIDRYESMEKFIIFFMSDVGDGEFHSVKGLGQKIYATCVVTGRMKNAAVDGGMLSAGMVIQGDTDSGAVNKMKMVRVGGFTIVEKGFSVLPNAFQPQIKGLMEVTQLLDQNMARNVGLDRPEITDTPGAKQPESLGQEKLKFMREYKLEHSDIDGYYVHLDVLYSEIKDRLLGKKWTEVTEGYKERQKFIEDCVKDGMPKQLLDHPELFTVTAARAIGYGSTALAHMVTNDAVAMAPYFDEKGKKAVMYDWLMVRVGRKKANEYLSMKDRNMIPTNEHVIATMENNFFEMGVPSVVGVDQMHVIHCLVHFEPLMKRAQEYIQQASSEPIEKTYPIFEVAMPHLSEHIDMMKDDPARVNEYKEFFGKFSELAKIYQKMGKDFQEFINQKAKTMQENQKTLQDAQQQSNDPDMKVKLAKVQADQQVAMIKEQNRARLAESKTQHSMMLKDALANQKLQQMRRQPAAR